jgi:hypothetical protein
MPWVSDRKLAHAIGVSFGENHGRRNAGIAAKSFRGFLKQEQAKGVAASMPWHCAAELARLDLRREAPVAGGGIGNRPASDNRIFEQANTESRDGRVLSSLPRTSCTG